MKSVLGLILGSILSGAIVPACAAELQPGPCQTLQQLLNHLARFNSSRVLSTFWMDLPPRVTVGQSFDATPKAQYNTIKRPLAWTENCVLQSYEGGPTATGAPLEFPYTIKVERRLPGETQWKDVSVSSRSPGERVLMSFPAQGEYRLTAALVDPKGVSPCGPVAAYHRVVDCYDPSLTRGRAIFNIEIQLPGPFSGTGMTVDGRSSAGPTGGCQPVKFMALVREGTIDWEAGGSQMVKDAGPPGPYGKTVWVLLESGKELERSKGSVYSFDPKRFGDGEYVLEARLDESDQAQGLQNFKTRPSSRTISVAYCGERSPELEKTAAEDASGKKTGRQARLEEIRLIDPDGTEDGQWVEWIPPPDKFFPGDKRASDTPRVPIDLAAICEKLAADIARRRAQFRVPCDPPLALMLALYRAPKVYNDLERRQGEIWNSLAGEIRGFAKPFIALEQVYLALLQKAVSSDLLVPRAVQEKELRQGPGGRPPLMGEEIPLAMFEFSPGKLEKLQKLEAEKRTLFEKWAIERRKAEAKIAELEQRQKTAAAELEKIHVQLEAMAAAHVTVKAKLIDLYYAGRYEHCLGLGTTTTRGFVPENGPHTALPGLEVLLPKPTRLPVKNLLPTVPAPLQLQELDPPFSQFVPLRFKYDGAKWVKSERKLLEALAAAKQKEFMGKVATFILYTCPATNLALTLGGDSEFQQAWASAFKAVSQDIPKATIEGLANVDVYLDKFLGTDISGKLSPQEKLKAMDILRAVNKLPWEVGEGFFKSSSDNVVSLYSGLFVHGGMDRMLGDPDFLTRSRELGESMQESTQAIALLKQELLVQEKFGEARSAGGQLVLELLMSKLGAAAVGKLAVKTESALKEGMSLVLRKLDDAAKAIARPIVNKIDDVRAWALHARGAKDAGLSLGSHADEFIKAADQVEETTRQVERTTQQLQEVRRARETRVLDEMKRTGKTDPEAVARELGERDDAFRQASRQEEELAGRVKAEKTAADKAADDALKLKDDVVEQGDEANRILEREKARVKHKLDATTEAKLEKALEEQRLALKEKPADWPKKERWPPIMSAGVVDEATGEVVTGFAGPRTFKDFNSKVLRDLEGEFDDLEKMARRNGLPDDQTIPRQKPGVCAEFMAIDQWLTKNPGKDPSNLVMRARYTKGGDLKPACRWCKWLAFRLKIKLLD